MSKPYTVDWTAYHAQVAPNTRALVDLASGRRFSYADMNDRVGRVAAHLISLGVKPGDRVGFLNMNSTDVMEMITGTWRIGAASLALNWRLTAPELEFIIKDAEPDVIFVDEGFAELAAELQKTTSVKHWIVTDGLGGPSAYETALANAQPLLKKTLDHPLEDMAILMYSSGTTGRPKGVIITHEMLFFAATNAASLSRIERNSVNLATMPLFHIGGINVFACPVLYAGGCSVVQRAFEPGETLDAFNDPDLAISHFIGVPAIYNALKMHPKNPETDFSRLKASLAGAEAVPDSLVNWWHERGVVIQEGYGMTETTASSCILPREDLPHMVGSCGKPLMHCEMKIAREDGSDADTGELGEIWMRGPVITPGYWNRPEANKESFVDGWFRSGDVGKRDENGFFYIEDRVKDMYISGGENVYPAEVENVLYELEAIAEVAVIGVEDSQWGEVGCAVVALADGQSLTMKDIATHVDGRLARFKQPVHMTIVEALPRNATGKVLKFELRKSVPAKLELR